jgi:hypothetical protein
MRASFYWQNGQHIFLIRSLHFLAGRAGIMAHFNADCADTIVRLKFAPGNGSCGTFTQVCLAIETGDGIIRRWIIT